MSFDHPRLIEAFHQVGLAEDIPTLLRLRLTPEQWLRDLTQNEVEEREFEACVAAEAVLHGPSLSEPNFDWSELEYVVNLRLAPVRQRDFLRHDSAEIDTVSLKRTPLRPRLARGVIKVQQKTRTGDSPWDLKELLQCRAFVGRDSSLFSKE